MPREYADIVWNPQKHRKASEVPVTANIDYTVPACKRGIDMLLAKFRGESYESEVKFPHPPEVQVPVLKCPLTRAKIAFVTDGGLVPAGNPDHIPPVNTDKFCVYPFYGAQSLKAEEYTVSHQGYDNQYVVENPNRLIPLDAARNAVKKGRIGSVFDFFYSTAGVMTSVENSKKFGEKIAASLIHSEVDAVILTSTCGTSTRCGAYIACEIEKAEIPVVHVTNLVDISEWIGCCRILGGYAVSHVFGRPDLSAEQERDFRYRLFGKALDLLEQIPPVNTSLVVRG